MNNNNNKQILSLLFDKYTLVFTKIRKNNDLETLKKLKIPIIINSYFLYDNIEFIVSKINNYIKSNKKVNIESFNYINNQLYYTINILYKKIRNNNFINKLEYILIQNDMFKYIKFTHNETSLILDIFYYNNINGNNNYYTEDKSITDKQKIELKNYLMDWMKDHIL